MTPRSITTEHLRRLFRDGRLITMADLRALHDGITKQAIQQKLASGQLPPPLGRISGRDVWDREEVLDYMIRRR